MLDKLLSAVFDEEHEFSEIWELKLIKFDINLDQKQKPYEVYIGISSNVQDSKGNAGIRGNFYLSNLRVLWHSGLDKQVNLSIGLDTITNASIKVVPIQGVGAMKYILTLKTISVNQTKYEFKFNGFGEKQEALFNQLLAVHRQVLETRNLRCVDLMLKLTPKMDLFLFPFQEEKSKYAECSFVQNQNQREIILYFTNVRMAVVDKNGVGYGIPWICLQSFEKTNMQDGRDAIKIKVRGFLRDVQMFIICKKKLDFSTMAKQLYSFSETYTKNPTLGIQSSSIQAIKAPTSSKILTKQVQEIEYTKVNLGRRKNAYDKEGLGDINQTCFSAELGIMMQRLPEGVTRSDLWNILRE